VVVVDVVAVVPVAVAGVITDGHGHDHDHGHGHGLLKLSRCCRESSRPAKKHDVGLDRPKPLLLFRPL
jgi:hypothetical protein